MNKLRLVLGGASIILSCAPAFSQGANPSATTNNYRGLQNLVDNANGGSRPVLGAPDPKGNGGASSPQFAPKRGGGHKWKGSGGGQMGAGPGGGPMGAGPGGGGLMGAGPGSGGPGGGGPMGGPFGAGPNGQGPGGGGFGDPAKREQRRARMLKKFDANGDGQLDESERAKFRAFREERRAQREAQGGGQFGGGQFGGGQANGGPGGFQGGGGGGGKHKHRHRDGMMGGPNQTSDGQPELPGGRRGGPGDFPQGFPDGGPSGKGGPPN